MNQDILDKGERAQRLLRNEDFAGVLRDMRDDAFAKFARADFLNDEELKSLHLEAKALALLERRIQSDAANARVEREQHDE